MTRDVTCAAERITIGDLVTVGANVTTIDDELPDSERCDHGRWQRWHGWQCGHKERATGCSCGRESIAELEKVVDKLEKLRKTL